MEKTLAAIAVVDDNLAIGKQGSLLCHLPADLKHFKELTMAHSIVMGRKTFESFPKGPLPGRQNIVITANQAYAAQGITVAHSIDEAVSAATMPGEVFIIGGAQIYAAFIRQVTVLHLTHIHASFPGADAFFPAINEAEWTVLSQEAHQPDDRNRYAYTFTTLIRK